MSDRLPYRKMLRPRRYFVVASFYDVPGAGHLRFFYSRRGAVAYAEKYPHPETVVSRHRRLWNFSKLPWWSDVVWRSAGWERACEQHVLRTLANKLAIWGRDA